MSLATQLAKLAQAVTVDSSKNVTLANTKITLGTTSLGAGNASTLKNRIINGAMVIDQRNAGASVTPTTAVYVVDRWRLDVSQASKFSAQQNAGSVTPPIGFSNYLGTTVVSAFSIGSGDYFTWNQPIEGFNTADLQWGTANAKTVTLSAWVYSSLTGTFGGALQNSATTYSYPFTYSIPVANTWTQISITVAGPTAGTWVGATNGMGLNIYFGLGVGSGYSGTANAWASANYKSATGATSVVATNGATFYITGVQLEVGSSATGFEYRQYTTELQLCQRYYWLAAYGVNSSIAMGSYVNGTQIRTTVKFPVSMRTVPALAATSGTDYYGMYCNGNDTFNSFTIYFPNTEMTSIYNNTESSGTIGQSGMVFTNSASASLAFTAEL